MKILVTGSSGTIGTRLCETLLEQGHEVVGADWEPCKWQPSVEALRCDVDLRDAEALKALPTDCDAIVHLAANARVYDLVKEPDLAMDNFVTVFNMLEFARKNGIKKFLFSSSRETYGNIDKEPLVESDADFANCESPYTASKIGGEALVEAYKRCYDMQTVILRFSNVYGMYDDSDRVIPLFIRQAQDNQPLTVFGEEKCLDFTYIDDTVAGVVQCIEQFENVASHTINLASGSGTTLVHLANRVRELLGSSSDLVIKDNRIGEVVRYVANIDTAKKCIGYSPKISFDEGIEKTVEWYK